MNAGIEQKLTDKKINPTAMRLLVLDLLLKQNSAVSLSDIEKGLTHIIDDGTGTPKYALCLEACDDHEHHDLHVHFYCTSCKETFCLPNSKIPDVMLPNGFTSSEMNLVVKGICDKCKN